MPRTLSIRERGGRAAHVASSSLIAGTPWFVLARTPARALVGFVSIGVLVSLLAYGKNERRWRAWLLVPIGVMGLSFVLPISVHPGQAGVRTTIALCGASFGLVVILQRPRRWRVLMVNLVLFVMLLGLAEIGLRVWAPQDLARERWEDLAARYPDAPTPAASPVMSMDHGLRRTEGQPSETSCRVLFFGGSTTFGAMVSDSETFPSQLQLLLESTYPRLRVENLGVQGSAAEHLLNDLVDGGAASDVGKLRSLTEDDLVVFYIGVNEAKNAVAFMGNPIDRYSFRLPGFRLIADWLRRYSNLGYLVQTAMGVGQPEIVQWSFDNTDLALSDAERLVTAKGAVFRVVLQPHAKTLAGPSAYERALIDQMDEFGDALSDVYPRMATIVLDGHSGIDGRAWLDGLKPSPFLDWNHVDGRGNRRIAQRLGAALEPDLERICSR